MGKFPFKRPRIISKKFPEVDNHIDHVRKSLESLVFSYSRHVDRSLQKKHLMMAVSSLALLVVVGSFISKGKADSVTFHPETCLGGWINPHHAEGNPETTSNADQSQFTEDNSSILPKNTGADIYCGNFTGKFDETTKPTKILISLSMTDGEDVSQQTIIEGTASSTSLQDLPIATTTETLGSTTTPLASSTELTATSTTATTTEATSSVAAEAVATSTPVTPGGQASTVLDGVVQSFNDTVHDILDFTHQEPETDTVVVPPPVVAPDDGSTGSSSSNAPTSLLPKVIDIAMHALARDVFAQTDGGSEVAPDQTAPQSTDSGADSIPPVITESNTESVVASSSEQEQESVTTISTSTDSTSELTATATEATTTEQVTLSTTTEGTTTESTTTQTTATGTEEITGEEQVKQSNFLEVFYTFDGHTWQSLGELNEISMKYRSFEIPVASSTSWSDMSNLQIKIASKGRQEPTPTVYLDAMTAEVLYETSVSHVHPDFTRDTILSDETVKDMRMVRLINNDTNKEEVWYMHLAATSTDEAATSTDGSVGDVATTTSGTTTPEDLPTAPLATSTEEASSTVIASSTETATSTPYIKPIIEKNRWYLYEGSLGDTATGEAPHEAIMKFELEKAKDDIDRTTPPDFATDLIKRMKGTYFGTVIVEIERDAADELWLYDASESKEEKIDSSTTTVAIDTPIGLKDGHLFWLSSDQTKVYAYNLTDKTIEETPLPAFDPSQGERGEVTFPDIPWKVIISTDDFSFYSQDTGEVFSDENAETVETLRRRVGLDQVLDKEEMSNLNLPVNADATSTEQPDTNQ